MKLRYGDCSRTGILFLVMIAVSCGQSYPNIIELKLTKHDRANLENEAEQPCYPRHPSRPGAPVTLDCCSTPQGPGTSCHGSESVIEIRICPLSNENNAPKIFCSPMRIKHSYIVHNSLSIESGSYARLHALWKQADSFLQSQQGYVSSRLYFPSFQKWILSNDQCRRMGKPRSIHKIRQKNQEIF